MKYECDMADSYYKGKKEGEARGISIGETRGESKATSRIVKGLKALGLSDEDIAKGTSISVEQVQNILRN